MTVKQVYEVVKEEGFGFDAIYEDFIMELVGSDGLEILLKNKLLETCGVINGRRLYVLCKLSN